MPCPKCSETLKRCPDIQSSDCVKFVGESNECLDYCKGQSVSEVIEQIGIETCTIKENTDVSEQVIPSCSLNFYQAQVYPEKNVKNLIDFLAKFDCNLQSQIDLINSNFSTYQPTVTVDWKCLSQNPCVTTGTVDLTTAIQNIINAYCNLEFSVQQQGLALSALTNTVNSLVNKYNNCLIPKLDELSTDINFQSCQTT